MCAFFSFLLWLAVSSRLRLMAFVKVCDYRCEKAKRCAIGYGWWYWSASVVPMRVGRFSHSFSGFRSVDFRHNLMPLYRPILCDWILICLPVVNIRINDVRIIFPNAAKSNVISFHFPFRFPQSFLGTLFTSFAGFVAAHVVSHPLESKDLKWCDGMECKIFFRANAGFHLWLWLWLGQAPFFYHFTWRLRFFHFPITN